MSRRGAQWTGWQTWEEWKGAGVVGEKLDYTDDNVITQQALGRTGSKITACRAMDAAVAYSLASYGPPATETVTNDDGTSYPQVVGGITADELVNDYTKRAYLIEQRIVGLGLFRDPDMPSCGHDEVLTDNIKVRRLESVEIKSYDGKHVAIVRVQHNHWNQKCLKLSDVSGYGLSDEDVLHLTSWVRADKIDAVALLERFIRAKWKIPEGAEILYMNNPILSKPSKGECKWVGDNAYHEEIIDGEVVKKKRVCAHHGDALIKGWGLHPNGSTDTYMELYSSDRCNMNWNKNMLQNLPNHIRDSPNWVRWEDVMRSLTQTAPHKEVKKLITKSLNRMMKRNDNVVYKVGLRNNARYSWSDWGWHREISEYIKRTTSMNRKVGDNVKGWVYGTIRERQSYGMSISDFVWRPAEDIDMKMYYYNICWYGKTGNYSWHSAKWHSLFTSEKLELFFSEEEALAKGQAFLDNMVDDKTSVKVKRTSQGIKSGLNYKVFSGSKELNFILKGDIAPEEYLTPQEIKRLAVNAHPSVIKTHRENFEHFTRPVSVKIIKEEEEEEVKA